MLANAQLIAQRMNEREMTARLQFTDGKGVDQGDAVKCRANDTIFRPGESEQGQKLTAEGIVEVAVPAGTEVKASWRGLITYPDGTTQKIFVFSTPPALSNQSQYTFLAKKVD